MPATAHLSLEIDQEAGAAYLRFSDNTVARTVEHTDDIVVDLDEQGVVVGIEILDLHKSVDLDAINADFHVRAEALATLLNALRASAPSSHVSSQAGAARPRPFGSVEVPRTLTGV